MLRKLPRWAWIGGSLLAFIAGSINAVGFMSFRHQAVTHLTGTTTELGVAVVHGNGPEVLHWVLAIASFVLGAMISGFIVQQRTLQLGRRYGVVLMLESLLLLAAVPLLHQQSDLGFYLASIACGLQNAMVSTYSGMVLRTTHLTGIFTDLGIYVGQRLRGLDVDMLRIHLSVLIAGSFLSGAIAGGFAFRVLGESTLLVPAVLTGIAGLLYTIYRHRAMRSDRVSPDSAGDV